MPIDEHFHVEDATGVVWVLGIGSQEVCFRSANANFDSFAYLISQHHCTNVSIEVSTPGSSINLGAIGKNSGIKTLSLAVNDKECKLSCSDDAAEVFRNLKEFEFRGEFPRDFPSFKLMSSLEKLTVDYNSENFDWSEHEGVFDLIVHHYKEMDLRPLVKMKSLRRLCLVQGALKALNGIEEIPSLETVHFVQTKNLTDLNALFKAKNVRNILFESYSKIKNWDCLIDMPQIEYLSLQEVDNIEFLSHLPNLVFFYAKKLRGKSFPTKQLDAIQSKLSEKLSPAQREQNLPFFARLA